MTQTILTQGAHPCVFAFFSAHLDGTGRPGLATCLPPGSRHARTAYSGRLASTEGGVARHVEQREPANPPGSAATLDYSDYTYYTEVEEEEISARGAKGAVGRIGLTLFVSLR